MNGKFKNQEEFNAALNKMESQLFEHVNATAGQELFILVDPEVHQECVDLIEEGEAAVKNTMCFNDLKERVNKIEIMVKEIHQNIFGKLTRRSKRNAHK